MKPAAQGGKEYIDRNVALDTKTSSGVIGSPTMHNGVSELIKTHSPDITNSATNLNQPIPTEDKGAKWERPHEQDAHPLAKNQYPNHS